jgi:hypothetical protein
MVEKDKSKLKKYHKYDEDIVYHYCSIDALFNIIKSKSFWLTSLNSSNDTRELKHGKQLYHQVLSEMIDTETDENKKFAYRTIFNEASKKEIKREVDSGDFYGLSFVRTRDSLTHWNSYGSDSTGVAIGLNKWMFKHLFESYAIMDMFSNWVHFERIIYNLDEQKKYIKWIIDDRLEMFRNSVFKIDGLEAMPDMSYYREHDFICKSLYYSGHDMIVPKFKHSGFIDESEERLFIRSGEADNLINLIESTPIESDAIKRNIINHLIEVIELLGVSEKNINFGVIGGTIRPYYKLDLSVIWSNALITEIIVGPKCYQNKTELRHFLKQYGLKGTKIIDSKIPVR